MRDIHTPRSIIQTSDGNYLVVRNRYPTPSENCCPSPEGDIYLLKTFPNGTLEWFDFYGDDNIAMDMANIVIQTGEDFVIAGRTNSPPAIGMDFMLIKTDLSGHLQWRRTYNRSYEGKIRAFIQTTDGGFALLGLSSPLENMASTDSTVWLIKTDAVGNVQWDQTYGQNFIEYTSMIQVDRGFVLTSYYGHLMKIDALGEIQWEKNIGGNLFSMVGTIDGGFALLGSKLDQPWLVKTDQSGNIEWNKTYPFDVAGDYIFSKNRSNILNIIQSFDDGFILTGSSVQVPPSGGLISDSNLWLVKTDGSGNMEWSHQFDVGTFASFVDVIQDSNGDVVIVGEKKRYNWIVKVDLPPFFSAESSGTINVEPTVTISENLISSISTLISDPTDTTTPFPGFVLILLIMGTILIFKGRRRI